MPVEIELNPVNLLAAALEALTFSDWEYADSIMAGRTLNPLSGLQALHYAIQHNQMNRGEPCNNYPPLLSRR